MFRHLKLAIFFLMKRLGLFRLCRYLTKDQLRILCYHGISTRDEHLFRPKLFMSPQLFESRMKWLSESPFRPVSLDSAVSRLAQAKSDALAVVITIDDGFYETYRTALPILKEFSLPATIYVTTYYALKETPVFNVLLAYVFWRTRVDHIDLTTIEPYLDGSYSLSDVHEARAAFEALLEYGQDHCTSSSRQDLLQRAARALQVDPDDLSSRSVCSLMNASQIHQVVSDGFDIQLHTHRHRFDPAKRGEIVLEIQENRDALTRCGARNLVHFCYPSGVWHEEALETLRRAGVKSATTCDRGLNPAGRDPLTLRRFLDGEDVTRLEFEAYLDGVYDVFDRATSIFRPRRVLP